MNGLLLLSRVNLPARFISEVSGSLPLQDPLLELLNRWHPSLFNKTLGSLTLNKWDKCSPWECSSLWLLWGWTNRCKDIQWWSNPRWWHPNSTWCSLRWASTCKARLTNINNLRWCSHKCRCKVSPRWCSNLSNTWCSLKCSSTCKAKSSKHNNRCTNSQWANLDNPKWCKGSLW